MTSVGSLPKDQGHVTRSPMLQPIVTGGAPLRRIQSYEDGSTAVSVEDNLRGFSAPVFSTARYAKQNLLMLLTNQTFIESYNKLYQSYGEEEMQALLEESLPSYSGHGGVSDTVAFFVLLKSFMGTGIIFLPGAFREAGLAFAILGLLVLSAWAMIGIHMMVAVKRKFGMRSATFGQLAAQAWGKRAGDFVNVGILAVQCGTTCTYMVFIGQNLHSVLQTLGSCNVFVRDWTVSEVVAAAFVLYTPLCLIRKMKWFGIPSFLGEVCAVGVLIYLLVVFSGKIATDGPSDIVAFNWNTIPVFIGATAFDFEGIQLCLPVEESMQHPERFHKVMKSMFAVLLTFYFLVGTLGYMAFGSGVQDVVLLSLPNNIGNVIVRLIYTLSIIFSVPIQFMPAIKILEDWSGYGVVSHKPVTSDAATHFTKKHPKLKSNIFRVVVLLCLLVLAIGGSSHILDFIAVSGAFTALPIGFAFPGILHWRAVLPTLPSGRNKTFYTVVDAISAIVGGVLTVYVTGSSIYNWIYHPTLSPANCVPS